MRTAPIALALLACAGATGCVGPLAPRPAATPEELAALRAKVVELQQRVTVNEVEIERLREQLATVSGSARSARPPRSSAASAPAAISPPADLEPARPRASAALEESDVQPAEVVASVPLRAGVLAPAGAAAQEAYNHAYSLFGEGKFAEAEAAFARFLATHGDTDLSDNAAYWIGETRFAGRDYEAALGAFRSAVETYPQGNKVPDALLKIGRCLEQLGAVADALDVYGELARRFPGTTAAASAEERLRQIP